MILAKRVKHTSIDRSIDQFRTATNGAFFCLSIFSVLCFSFHNDGNSLPIARYSRDFWHTFNSHRILIRSLCFSRWVFFRLHSNHSFWGQRTYAYIFYVYTLFNVPFSNVITIRKRRRWSETNEREQNMSQRKYRLRWMTCAFPAHSLHLYEILSMIHRGCLLDTVS